MSCSGRARCRSGGSPPSSFLWLCAADARDLFQVSPPAHARVAHAAGAGGPFPFLFLALWWGLRCRFWGSLPNPWLRAMGMCCWASSPPLFPPPWWLHALSARDRSGGNLPSSQFPCMPHTGSVHCQVFPLPLYPFHPVLPALLWPHGRPRSLGTPCWLDRLPALLAPDSRTRGALA